MQGQEAVVARQPRPGTRLLAARAIAVHGGPLVAPRCRQYWCVKIHSMFKLVFCASWGTIRGALVAARLRKPWCVVISLLGVAIQPVMFNACRTSRYSSWWRFGGG